MTDVLIATSTNTLGTKIIANRLRQNGISVCESIIPENTIELIAKLKPRILNINWLYNDPTYDFIFDCLPEIRKLFPEMKIVFGGYTATYDWKNLKNMDFCDAILGGESDDSIIECTKDLLSGKKIDKLKYLRTPLPDLSNYDYDNNIVETDDSLMFETARSCPNAKSNRCWYCTQFQTPFRPLDLNKTIQALRKRANQSGKRKKFILANPETTAQTVNKLWDTFHTTIWCYIMPQHFRWISPEVKGCEFFTGYDISTDKTLRYNHAEKYVDDIVRVAQNNKVYLGSVIMGDKVPEATRKEHEKLTSRSPNISIEYSSFIKYPGVNNEPPATNIYKNRTIIETYRPILLEGQMAMNEIPVESLISHLQQYKISDVPDQLFARLGIKIIGQYNIESIPSVITTDKVDNIKDECVVQRINASKGIYKCLLKRDLQR